MTTNPPSGEINQRIDHATGTVYQFGAVRDVYLGSPPPQPEDTDQPELRNPYKALNAFTHNDVADFFGREAVTDELVQILIPSEQPHPGNRLLAVVGASGSGKSSVVRAGLIPKLLKGAVPGIPWWEVVRITPAEQPLESLATQLRASGDLKSIIPSDLLRELRSDDARGLHRLAESALAGQEHDARLLLFVDQFEELYTLTAKADEREHFIRSLLTAAATPNGRTVVVFTVRADFYGRLTETEQLKEWLPQRQVNIGRMSLSELHQAIVGPAENVGLTFEDGLVERILEDVEDEPGALPLLEFALDRLYLGRDERTLTIAAYKASGGVQGALARTADEAFERLPEEQQALLRRALLRMVTLGEGQEDTRRRVPLSELLPVGQAQAPVEEALRQFTARRLLTADEQDAQPTYEVSHEALISKWTRLQGWLDEDRDNQRLLRQLNADAQRWETENRNRDFLANRVMVERSTNQLDPARLTLAETAYLRSSMQRVERNRQLRRLATYGSVAVAIVMLFLSIFSVDQSRRANEHAAAAQTAAAAAISARATSDTNAKHSESLRLAAEAAGILQLDGNAEVAASLAVRALDTAYTSQADAALAQAVNRLYTVQSFPDQTLALFSSDDTKILTGGHEGAQLWDRATGERLQHFSIDPGRRVISIDLSPDNTLVLTGHYGFGARLWNAETGELLYDHFDHGSDMYQFATFSPDGSQILVSGFNNNAAYLWDTVTGALVNTFIEQQATHNGVAIFSPDGTRVLVPSRAPRYWLGLWDVETGERLHTFAEDEQWDSTSVFSPMAFSPDGGQVLMNDLNGTTQIWNTTTGELEQVLTGDVGVVRSAYSQDGMRIVTGGGDGMIRLWDTMTGEMLRQFSGHTDAIYDMTFSPDGTRIASGSADRTVRVWNVYTGDLLQLLTGHLDYARDITYSSDGFELLSIGRDGARLWDVTGTTQRVFEGHVGDVTCMTLSSDGQLLLTGGLDGTVRLWDVDSSQELLVIPAHEDNVWSVAFSPDGRQILSGSADGTAKLWLFDPNTVEDEDVTSPEWVVEEHEFHIITGVAFSPDGHSTLVGLSGGETWLIEAATGEVLDIYLQGGQYGSQYDRNAVVFSPDGRFALTAANDVVHMWDIATGELAESFSSHSGVVYSLAFAPDGSRILTGSGDQTAILWDVATGQSERAFYGHTFNVLDVAISHDGRFVLTGSDDRTARLWDAETGALLRVFSGPMDDVLSVSFSSDESQIFTASRDGSVRLWFTDWHESLSYARERIFRDLSAEELIRYSIHDTR